MSDLSSRYTLIFNGEIYNFIEIRAELIKKGHVFKSCSDAEVVLYAYVEWGVKCVNKFNGMWALAIWDSLKAELFLSRDRFGKKPLFYAVVDEKFIFASEMKAIYPFLQSVKPSQDFNWMKNNIFLYESTDKCLVDGIKRFPFGHNGIYKDGKLKVNRYWNTLDHLVEVPNDYEEQIEQFRSLFLDACKIRMRSDVAIGTALSGGLDSSATISAMEKQSCTSMTSISFARNPDIAYASFAAIAVALKEVKSFIPLSDIGPDACPDPRIFTGLSTKFFAISVGQRRTEAAPSLMGGQSNRRIGSEISLEVMTSSTFISFWNIALGLLVPLR